MALGHDESHFSTKIMLEFTSAGIKTDVGARFKYEMIGINKYEEISPSHNYSDSVQKAA